MSTLLLILLDLLFYRFFVDYLVIIIFSERMTLRMRRGRRSRILSLILNINSILIYWHHLTILLFFLLRFEGSNDRGWWYRIYSFVTLRLINLWCNVPFQVACWCWLNNWLNNWLAIENRWLFTDRSLKVITLITIKAFSTTSILILNPRWEAIVFLKNRNPEIGRRCLWVATPRS